mmetsp:Transcript_23504/g.36804  ORF Transcript_23504/g.36804 Transcript_23504/m.36804 type:complete len:235 (-) Transcript_23504:1008-1712(-)
MKDRVLPLLPHFLNRTMMTIMKQLTNGMTTATIVASNMHHHPVVVVPSLSILPTTTLEVFTTPPPPHGGEGTRHRHPHDLLLLLLRHRRRLLILPHFSIDLYQEVFMILLPCPSLTFYSSRHHHPTTTVMVVAMEEKYSTKTQSSINSYVSSAHTNHPSKWSKWKATAIASSAPSPSKSTAIKGCTPRYERTVWTLWNETYPTFKTLSPTKGSINTLLANDRLACTEITQRFKP